MRSFFAYPLIVLGAIFGATGAIVAWAVDYQTSAFDFNTAGVILFVIGVILFVVGLIFAALPDPDDKGNYYHRL
jgi:H+/Cl- antiporter ClcA